MTRTLFGLIGDESPSTFGVFTCEVIQILQQLLFSGEVQGKRVKGVSEVYLRD